MNRWFWNRGWAVCAASAAVGWAASVTAQPPAASLVVTAPAVQREVMAGQSFVGTVFPTERAVVGSAVDGRVIERPCEEGMRVEEGAPLAQLLTQTISLELEAAKAELDYRQAMLNELENGTRPKELEVAQAQVAAAEARSAYLAAKLRRTELAYESGRAVSEDEVEAAESASIEAAQLLEQARAELALADEGPRVERIEQARAQVAMQAAVVERLSDQISKHTVRARFTGYVVAEFTERGAWVKRGDPVAEIAALDEVEIVVQVVEQHVPYIEVGADVTVEVPAVDRPTWPGKVAAVVPQADVKARTFPVKIRVVNEITLSGPRLKAGMSARVVLPTGKQQQATLVMKDALVLGGQSPMVYIVQSAADGTTTASPSPVRLGVAQGEWIQVLGQVEPGQQIVVQGNERLRPGQPVKIMRTLDELPTSSAL